MKQELIDRFNNETPEDVKLHLKAFMRFIVTTYAEDKIKAYDFIEYTFNGVATDKERQQLDKTLSKAKRRNLREQA